ncbi:hypothetical protein Mapa_000310 [Marchantia paleacea]|nr:hypothetical protein Mapa_000310 [Marchantia paleacea]
MVVLLLVLYPKPAHGSSILIWVIFPHRPNFLHFTFHEPGEPCDTVHVSLGLKIARHPEYLYGKRWSSTKRP